MQNDFEYPQPKIKIRRSLIVVYMACYRVFHFFHQEMALRMNDGSILYGYIIQQFLISLQIMAILNS